MDELKINELVDTGLDVLQATLKASNPSKIQLIKARIASSVFSTATRLEATRNARLSLQVRVAQMVLGDAKERKEYLSLSSPELKLLK